MKDMDASIGFEPVNALEEALLAVSKDPTDPGVLHTFIVRLISSQLAVLLHGQADAPPPKEVVMLVLKGANGTPMLAALTSPERAIPWARRFGEFGHALVTDARWVLKNVPEGCGVAINLGWAVGLEWSADGLKKLLRDFNV